MSDIQELKKKVNKILSDREIPEELKDMVKEVEQEYEEVCQNFLNENINQQDLGKVIERAIDYSRENEKSSLFQIKKIYGKDCEEKISDIISTVKTIERKMEERDVSEFEKEDRIKEAVSDKGRTYKKAGRISDAVIESLQNSRNQLMRNLELIKTPEEKKEYIYQQIRLIENKAKMNFGNRGIDILLEDNKAIVDSIMQEYTEEKDINKEKDENDNQQIENDNGNLDEKTQVQRFREEIKVEQKDLKPIEEVKKEQEEIDKIKKALPSDILK